MLSSRVLKTAVLGLMIFAVGCDRQSSDKAQPPAASSSASAPSDSSGPPSGQLDRSHAGSAMPEFVLDDSAGNQLRLSSLRGKPVLINLWATWCRPCIAELPLLAKLAQNPNLQVIAISQDSGEPAKVAAFLKDRELTALGTWLDPENDLSFHYGSGTLPTTVFYDAQGREVWRYVGERDWTSAESRKLLGI